MKAIKDHWGLLTGIALVISACLIRLWAYGDIRLSMANNDTSSYVTSSEVHLLSWEAFTGRRLFTTNVIYQLLEREGGYEILVNGSQNTKNRRVQPGFVNIIRLHVILSLVSWSALALALASRLRNKLLQSLLAFVILLFAFVPPVADWDSLLTSESLTFSLFALQLALLSILVFRLARDPAPTTGTILLASAWLLIVFLWTFLRDSNLYGILVDLVMVLALFLFPAFRKQKYLIVISMILGGIFLLGWISSSQSPRASIQIRQVFHVVILPDPARVEFMQARGMPAPGSPEYAGWFKTQAKDAYLEYLVLHPGYVVTIVFRDLLIAFADNAQPYFNIGNLPWRNVLSPIGDALHPETPSPFFLDVILLLGMWSIAVKKKIPGALP